jgi:hypothetical protein
LKRRSAKTAGIYKQWVPRRTDWLFEGGCCLCGGAGQDVHEIIGGTAYRMKAFVEPCCWLRVCREHHDQLQYMAKVDQLALKLLTDPQNFDLDRFHSVWGKPTTAITPAEVLYAVRRRLLTD